LSLSNKISNEASIARAAEASLSAAHLVVSNALSNEISVARAAEASMSVAFLAGSNFASQCSQYASIASQAASACSQYASQVSQYASIVSSQTQGLQSRILATEAQMSVASNLASLNISVAANSTYKIEWNLMMSHAASAVVSVAISGPALTNAFIWGHAHASVGFAAGVSMQHGALVGYGTICQLTANAAGVTGAYVDGLFVIAGAGGNIVISTGVATAALMGVKPGSLVRAWKVG